MVTKYPNYLVNKSLSASFNGDPINLRNSSGQLKIRFVSTATGTPNGALTLQGSDDLDSWEDVPGAFALLPASGNLAAQTRVCLWSGLNYDYVRLVWTTAGGVGVGSTINATARVQ